MTPCWEPAGACRAWTSVCDPVLGPKQGRCHGLPVMTEQVSLWHYGVPEPLETQRRICAGKSRSQCCLRAGEDEPEGLNYLVEVNLDWEKWKEKR